MPTLLPPNLNAAIPCHRCGYDVRAQPADGGCPECEASVVESRRMALIPRRPDWRDSDPRWRRRMVAGVWVLVLVPLSTVLKELGWSRSLPAPKFFAVQAGQSLDESYVTIVYTYLMFCIGIVLLFSKERGRQLGPFDATRRWGVVGSYLVALLAIPQFAFICSLVLAGIAALCLSLPRVNQPALTLWFVKIATGYIYYGPHESRLSDAALTACSSMLILLACVPLCNALRSSGSRLAAGFILVPLALAAAVQCAYAVLYMLKLYANDSYLIEYTSFYFAPHWLARGLVEHNWLAPGRGFVVEAFKWLLFLAIAVWLSIAQIAATRRRSADA